ncbi:unnamed protein product [Clavelina lepadiformis]|uniref:Uncharacterized protein n=1 Tax=Clavelina lepadiformis TaxID=159417 RepID=A0ABP0G9K0_CLALP
MFPHRKHEKQQDSLNCGPIALKEARRILNKSSVEEQIDFDTDSESCKKHQMDFGNLLLYSTDYDVLLSFCNICHNQHPSEVDQQKTMGKSCSSYNTLTWADLTIIACSLVDPEWKACCSSVKNPLRNKMKE